MKYLKITKKDLILPFLSIENNMIKISARIKDSEKIKRKELIDEINNYLETQFDNIEEYHVNGLLVLYNNMLQSLFGSQIKSFGIILLSIFVMFIILFQSLKISLLGMIPNIVASTFIFRSNWSIENTFGHNDNHYSCSYHRYSC